MKISKAETGRLDGRLCMWIRGTEGQIKELAEFVDQESYDDFVKLVKAGYFNPKSMKKLKR